MCIINEEDKEECHCPTECQEDVKDPHCSVFHSDYENLCEVHRHACRMQINVAIKHKGKCEGLNGCT